MKKNLLLLSAILFLSAGECYSQSFLKKLSNGIENASKKLDEILQVEEPVASKETGMTEQQSNASSVEKLTLEQMHQLFRGAYGQNSKLPEKTGQISPTKILYYEYMMTTVWCLY